MKVAYTIRNFVPPSFTALKDRRKRYISRSLKQIMYLSKCKMKAFLKIEHSGKY
jgi:hypothetical protein